MIEIIIPISSSSKFFPNEEYYFPKPLVDVDGTPLILKVIKNIQKYLNPKKFIFIIPKSLETSFSLGNILKLACNSTVEIVERMEKTDGGLCSSLLAIDSISENHELLILNMDDIIDFDLSEVIDSFRSNNSDSGLIGFEASHPRWCYLKHDSDNLVKMCAEKRVISKIASAGFYYFKNKNLFIDSCMQTMLDGELINGLFYISSAINQLILKGKKVTFFKIPSFKYHSLYSPESIKEYERYLNSYGKSNDIGETNDLNLVIPAAGIGSRFANEGWQSPKPFIHINGRLMIELVIENLNTNSNNKIILFRKEQIKHIDKNSVLNKSKIIAIDRVTEGTACTVLKARKFIDNNSPLLIANSDQIVDFDVEEFINYLYINDLDGLILVFKDPHKSDKWSFVKINDSGLVIEVAEKKPISDLATVGIYLFRKGSDFCKSALDMIVNNERVNNEFYTCPVYNYMINSGAKVGIFEIPYENMHGIGTPHDLREFIEKKGYKPSLDDPNLNRK